MEKKSIAKNYAFLAVMLGAMILGAILGWVWPAQVDGDGSVISGTGATVQIGRASCRERVYTPV